MPSKVIKNGNEGRTTSTSKIKCQMILLCSSLISHVFYYLSSKARRKFQKSPRRLSAMKKTFPTPNSRTVNKVCFAVNMPRKGDNLPFVFQSL